MGHHLELNLCPEGMCNLATGNRKLENRKWTLITQSMLMITLTRVSCDFKEERLNLKSMERNLSV